MAEVNYSAITKEDIQDPTLYRLNSLLRFFAEQISAVQGGTGPFRFQAEMTAPSIQLESAEIPENPLQVLTRGAGDALYGPEALARNLSTGRFQGTPIGGNVGEGTGGGSSGGGGGGSTRVQVSYGAFYQDSIQRILNEKLGETVSVLDFGATGDGVEDSTDAFQAAIDAVRLVGRSTEILVPAGIYRIRQLVVPPGTSPVRFRGQGEGSVIQFWTRFDTATETWQVPTGQGRIQIQASNVSFADLVLDGNQVNAVRMTYGAIAGDDLLTAPLSNNSTVWIEGQVGETIEGFLFHNVVFRHSLGHTVIADARVGNVRNVTLNQCRFENIRGGVFGETTSSGVVNRTGAAVSLVSGSPFTAAMAGSWLVIGDRVYLVQTFTDASNLVLANDEAGNPPFGSETGVQYSWGSDMTYGGPACCVYYRNSGTAPGDPIVSNLAIVGCQFWRVSGVGILGDGTGVESLNSSITAIGNVYFEIGLGGIGPGASTGISCSGNVGRRIGYVTTNDSAAAVPRYLANRQAYFIRTNKLVRGFAIQGNGVFSINGDSYYCSGATDGAVMGNAAYVPRPGQPMFNDDSVGSYGTVGNNLSRGVIIDNYFQADGAENVVVDANDINNTGLGGIFLRNARRCVVRNNRISLPAGALEIPVFITNSNGFVNGVLQTYGEWQASGRHRSFDNDIADNIFELDNPVKVAIQEVVLNDPISGLPFSFQATDVNRVFSNKVLGNSAGEFIKASTSGSFVGFLLGTPDAAQTSRSFLRVSRDGFGATATTKFSFDDGSSQAEIFRLVEQPYQFLVGGNAAGQGQLLTANRLALPLTDLVGTGKGYFDAFLWLRDDTFDDAQADSLDDTQGLIAWDSVNKKIIASETTDSGARVWVNLLGQSTSPGGPTNAVQFNDGGTFAGDANLSWFDTDRYLQIFGNAAIVGQVGDEADILFIVRAANSQTGNLTEWRDAVGNGLLAVAANGGLYFRTQSLVAAGGLGVIGYDTADNLLKLSNNGGPFEPFVIGATLKTLNGLTDPNITIVGLAPGINVTTSGANIVVVQNTGVLSVNGATGAIFLSGAGSPNGIQVSQIGPSEFIFSLPQALGTGAVPTFDSVFLSNLTVGVNAFGSIRITPLNLSVGYEIGGIKVIDAFGQFVGQGVFVPGTVQGSSIDGQAFISRATGVPLAGRTGPVVISGTTLTFSGGLLI